MSQTSVSTPTALEAKFEFKYLVLEAFVNSNFGPPNYSPYKFLG